MALWGFARAQVTDFWGKLWLGAGNATAGAVRAALAHVRQQPYWDRSNGADHFMVFSYDRGARLGHPVLITPSCAKVAVWPSTYGILFQRCHLPIHGNGLG